MTVPQPHLIGLRRRTAGLQRPRPIFQFSGAYCVYLTYRSLCCVEAARIAATTHGASSGGPRGEGGESLRRAPAPELQGISLKGRKELFCRGLEKFSRLRGDMIIMGTCGLFLQLGGPLRAPLKESEVCLGLV